MSAIAKLEPRPGPMSMSLFDPAQFASLMQVADCLSKSTLVPDAYLDKPANVLIALELAARLNASPLMIMQNLAVIDGRPSWSAVFVIAAIKSCGQFTPLDFEYEDLGEKTVQYTKYWQKNPQTGKSQPVMAEMTIQDIRCIAWATEKATGKRLESPEVTVEMAVKEGWYNRIGSKWPNMTRLMLSYRAASFFGKRYAPDLLMGMPTQDEAADIKEAIAITGSAETTGPNKPTGGVAGLKARLQPGDTVDPPPDSAPSADDSGFNALMLAIENSQTLEGLEIYRQMVRALKGQEKRMAVAAWKEKESALTPPPDLVATITAAIAAATTHDDLNALMPLFEQVSEEQFEPLYAQYIAKRDSLGHTAID